MKILENMDLCYGCGACDNICPKGAISMRPSEEGFLYPSIDQSLCIECGACRSVCPQLNARYDTSRKPDVYAIMADDDIRALSASGGVFSLLAEYAFRRDGYVCGAAFSQDFRSVRHIMINSRKDLDKLRRSKYVQSENGDIHKQIRDKLNQGKFVLFVGTPCQCAALRNFLKKPWENLLVVDLICHGTPSPLAWNKFLDETAGERVIKDVNFRYKGAIGWSTTTHIEFESGEPYTKLFKDCQFEQAFSRNLISRKSCGSCQFARIPRQGDITIGDFWGANKYKKELDDRKGTSVILVNTDKGRQVYEELKEKGSFKKSASVPFQQAFGTNNSNIYRFSNSHPGHGKFYQALAQGKMFSEALSASRSARYDIMLFSIWYAANYGSLMTNFALYKVLTDLGYNCIFADIPDHLWPGSKGHRDHLAITRHFGYKHFQLTGKYKNRVDLKKVNALADTFVVGSDQIWNYSLCKSAGTFFYLDFADEDKKKIAYGTSFGHSSFNGDENARRSAGFYLNRFDAVSVREDYAVDLCRDEFGVDAVQVLDPVFMCDKRHYFRCIDESALNRNPPEKKYVLAYILDPTEEKQRLLEETARRMDADLLVIPNAVVRSDMRAAWYLPLLENIDMEDWLYYFSHAEMVITDSFHGTCFSIIFEKPFIAIGNKRRGLERFHSLLNNFGLTDRLVLSPGEALKREELFSQPIDYVSVNQALDALRSESMEWLRNALNSEKRAPVYSAYDLLDRRIDQLYALVDKIPQEITEQQQAFQQDNHVAKAGQNAQPSSNYEHLLEGLFNLLSRQADDQNKQIIEQNEMLLQQQKELTEKVNDMENSFSWRVTKPLRAFRRILGGQEK